jgi:hypothetical protein
MTRMRTGWRAPRWRWLTGALGHRRTAEWWGRRAGDGGELGTATVGWGQRRLGRRRRVERWRRSVERLRQRQRRNENEPARAMFGSYYINPHRPVYGADRDNVIPVGPDTE